MPKAISIKPFYFRAEAHLWCHTFYKQRSALSCGVPQNNGADYTLLSYSLSSPYPHFFLKSFKKKISARSLASILTKKKLHHHCRKFKNPHFFNKDRASAVKEQRKTGIYQKSVKKESCEFACNAVLSKNVLPSYIFWQWFYSGEAKVSSKVYDHVHFWRRILARPKYRFCMEPTAFHGGSPLFSRVLSHKTMFFFYFAFTAESLCSIAVLQHEKRIWALKLSS